MRKCIGCSGTPRLQETWYLQKNAELNPWRQRKNDIYIINAITSNPILIANASHPEFPSPLHILFRIQDFDLHSKMRGTEASLIKKVGYKGLTSLNKIMTQASRAPPSNVEIMEINRFLKNLTIFTLIKYMKIIVWLFIIIQEYIMKQNKNWFIN